MSGKALEMNLRLKHLMRKYGTSIEPHILPLNDPMSGDVMVEGFASTTDVDLDRVSFRAYAFPLAGTLPPLLYRHGAVAGEIRELGYDAKGNLRITARVTHEYAKRCPAFSICARITGYEMREADTVNFHAVATGEIVEISLTDAPANPKALVTQRYPAPAVVGFYDLMLRKTRLLAGMTALLKEISTHDEPDRTSSPPGLAQPLAADRRVRRHDARPAAAIHSPYVHSDAGADRSAGESDADTSGGDQIEWLTRQAHQSSAGRCTHTTAN